MATTAFNILDLILFIFIGSCNTISEPLLSGVVQRFLNRVQDQISRGWRRLNRSLILNFLYLLYDMPVDQRIIYWFGELQKNRSLSRI